MLASLYNAIHDDDNDDNDDVDYDSTVVIVADLVGL